MTKTHEIKLDGYGAHTTLAEDRPIMLLGTAESYGIETLHVVSGKSWEGLTVTATFNAPDGTSTDMLMDTDGSITVPPEATAKSGSGKIVFTGVSNGVQRISCDLEYFVVAHSAINGVQSGGTAPSWFEQAATRFMPTGGTAGQVLTKVTDTDFNAEWQDSQGGAGGITPTIGDNGNWYLGNTDTGKPSRGEKGDTGATGADGKSAYSYAQDGGYTGTEAEFAAKLAAESIDKALFVVNITSTDGETYSADKTYEEIIKAYDEGKYNIVAVANGIIMPLVSIMGSHDAIFGCTLDNNVLSISIADFNKVIVEMTPLATTTSKLPNPYPLTFTGAVSETYDGSSAKTIEIPSGGGGNNELTLLADINFEGNTSIGFEYTDLDDVSEIYIVGAEIKSGLDNSEARFSLKINDIEISANAVLNIQKASGTETWNSYYIAKFNGAFWEPLRSPNHGGANPVAHTTSPLYPNSVVLNVGKAKKLYLYVTNPAYKPVTGWMKIWVR